MVEEEEEVEEVEEVEDHDDDTDDDWRESREVGWGIRTFWSGRLAVPHDVHAIFGEEITPFFFEGDVVGDVVEFS